MIYLNFAGLDFKKKKKQTIIFINAFFKKFSRTLQLRVF